MTWDGMFVDLTNGVERERARSRGWMDGERVRG